MALTSGMRVAGKYLIERKLGEGGMGEVYVALNERLQMRVALKVLGPHVTSMPGAADRFFREAIAASRAKHPGVVQVFDADVHEGIPWIAMELLEGESLGARLLRGPLDVATAVRVVTEAISAVAAVHDVGIIHRDLKPDNLFLERISGGERVKILDFGIAKVHVEGLSGLTKTGTAIGTPEYLAPEQARGAKHVDPRVDVYALGAILFHAVAGRTPYQAESFGELVARMFTEGPPRIASLVPAIPAPLAALIDRSLSVDPAGRPQTVRALGEELARAYDEAMRGGPPAMAATMALPPSALPTPPPASTTPLPASAFPPIATAPHGGTSPRPAPVVPNVPTAPHGGTTPRPDPAFGMAPTAMSAGPTPPPQPAQWGAAPLPTARPASGGRRTSGALVALGGVAIVLLFAVGLGGVWAVAGTEPTTPIAVAPTTPRPPPDIPAAPEEQPVVEPTPGGAEGQHGPVGIPSGPAHGEGSGEGDTVPLSRSNDGESRVPRIRTGAADVRGSLSREVIRRVIRNHIDEVRSCYERQLDTTPGLAGRVAVSFIISPSGAVQSAQVSSSTLGSPPVEQCIVAAVRGWRFPAPEGGGVVGVSYPFMLDSTRADGGARGERPGDDGTRSASTEPPREQRSAQGSTGDVDGLLDRALGGGTQTTPAEQPSGGLPATPPRAEVARVLGRLMPGMRACAGDLVGTASATVVITGQSGRVASATVGGSPFAGTPQGSCMEGVLRRAEFSRFTQPSVRIVYPFTFR